MSWRISGRRVTMPEPRGKKSLTKIEKKVSWIELPSRLLTKASSRSMHRGSANNRKFFFSLAASNWSVMSSGYLQERGQRRCSLLSWLDLILWAVLSRHRANYFISHTLVGLFFRSSPTQPLRLIDFYSTNTTIAKIRIFRLFFSPFSSEGWIMFWISLTCPRSSPARMIYQPIVLPQQRSEANRFAYEHPSMWMHPGACWWSEWGFPFPDCPTWWPRFCFHCPKQLINASRFSMNFSRFSEIFLHRILIQPIENWIGWPA